MTQNNLFQKATLVAAGIAVSAIGAHAQGLLVSNGTIIAANGDQAPGAATGVLFNGTSTFDNGVMDDAGNVFFRARLQGAGVTPTTERAYYIGTDRSNLTLVIRSGDLVPTLSNGEVLSTLAGNGPGGSPRISSNGKMFWGSNMVGGTITTANDTALFTGTPGNFVIAAREGDPAPGTAGATLGATFSNPSQQPTAINAAGRIVFQSSTLGGDTTTANNAGWFGGVPGALEMIIRKGDAIPSGEVIGALGFQVLLNASGQGFHDESLSTTLGTPPATTANDRVLMVYTPGGTPGTGTNAVLLREGDAAFGTTSFITGFFGFGATPWNNNGKAFVNCTLAPTGDVVGTTNNLIHYLAQIGSQTVVLRKGDVAPGTGGLTFGTLNDSQSILNNNDRVAFQCQLVGGSVTTADDSSVWTGPVGGLQMIMREGDPALGTTGALYGSVAGTGNFWLNDQNRVTFQTSLVGGDVVAGVNDSAFYSWDPVSGLALILRKGSQIEIQPTVFKTVSSWGGIQFTNGDGHALTFNPLGKMTLRVNFSDGAAAIMSVFAPGQTGTPFCAGDGSGTACPCANSGAAGHGCANFNFASGARLFGSGTAGASIATDTFVLTATNIPGPGLFFQGDGTFGSGLVFGDGLLCAGGNLIRMGVVFPTGNSASYPGGTTPAPIHIAGATASGDVRYYQCWYRDSGETSPGISFCTSDTYNLTQGVAVTWGP